MDLSGKTALITGASRGIGLAIAQRLSAAGCRVVGVSRGAATLEARALEAGFEAKAVDLCAADGCRNLLAWLEAEGHQVDILVNNAGIAPSAPLAHTGDEVWEQTFLLNVTVPFRLCRGLLPAMAKNGYGRIVNIASNAGLTGYAYTSAYVASKHALVGLTRALAAEFARKNVTINALCPGFVDTDLAQAAAANISKKTQRSLDESRGALAKMSPQNRLMTPEEVAHFALSLLPAGARGMTGQTLAIDGGQVM